MAEKRLEDQMKFLLEIDKEKNILRQTHLSGHGRRENDAEHAWHMAIMIYLLREYANEKIDLDEEVYHSEKATGSKNRALAYLLKAHGLIHGDVEELLDCYFRACSIRVSAADLARIGCVLACHGQLPDGQRLFPAAYGRFVNANLMTCGMYDGSGDFAIRVGVPAKSGVGGGIMAVVPGRMGVGLFGPALDEKGNSLAGIRALELLSARLDLSVF